MWSAHLVFGDINKSSDYSFADRVYAQKIFQDICQKWKPRELNSHSFYDVDNDSIMAGFSSQMNLVSGKDVLDFTIRLHGELSKNNIDVSFGVYLIAFGGDIDWKTAKGFIDNKTMLHIDDDVYNQLNYIDRSQVCGDCLITVSRLQTLAKILQVPICYTEMNGGHLNDYQDDNFLRANNVDDVSHLYHRLKHDYQYWLQKNGVKTYSLQYKI